MTLRQIFESNPKRPDETVSDYVRRVKPDSCSEHTARTAYYKMGRNKVESKPSGILDGQLFNMDGVKEAFIKVWSEIEERVKPVEKAEERRVLVIGDTHIPFERKGYLKHCKDTYDRFGCNRVVHIGDILDFHANSYHESNPSGYSPGQELNVAKDILKEWYSVFPKVDVILGNHDRLIQRKLHTNGIPEIWLRKMNEILGVPNWEFHLNLEIDNVMYVHGEGGGGINGALSKSLNFRKSIVQGHFHTESHIRWNVSELDRLFAMQVGCGVNDKAYAMEYAKFNIKKSIISCGVVLDNGTLPIVVPMDL